ncbi:RNA polymerase sigma-70 factor [Chitinophaga sp. MM2321]|uniref:RNA polymerase sigma factor n=1 Tax=Chitinophaga sp. MM2321 TaxID=3137178 RepID=UPI0032D57BCC
MIHEKDLIAELIKGDAQSFRKIYDLYIKKVYHFVRHYVKEKSEADDITQNVFIKIWEKRNVINTEKSFEGFVFTIAYRAIIDRFRQNAAKPYFNTRDMIDPQIASSVCSDDLLHLHQLESLYNKSLQTLPPKRKEIFLLSRHNGLTNKQIAEKLGISIKTVENQMTAALSSLKESLLNSELDITIAIFLFFFF